ncbi:phosphate:acyl-[acyl carrier protein] acyltransferase [Mycoplasma testudineum]|uniref:Phosphate acyltransferase n=1 Tax=Mycoplasma testudineum TaxID=244584 RepID=A0A4V6PSB3_9MOLU|nr:phosphate acyltransferase PlsX [Mycoplasma testudineum]OYD26597.1 phosphate acyltransferase [Mycoplasma testudineum]TDO19429.1 phosphate:acyl-[acyl carrier protein] acyltransferase [Mycoplasma testudineum]
MFKIAIDVMGNDLGIKPALDALLDFSNKNPNYYFYIVGDKTEIEKYIKTNSNFEIINNPTVVSLKSNSLLEIKKIDTSMKEGIFLLKDKKVDAFISSGDTASLLAYSVLFIKRLENISRPAFMPIFPTTTLNKKFLVLDVGANLEVKPEYLVNWAKIGKVFSEEILKIENPRINLLNVGTESYKGFGWHHEADERLKSELPEFYKGFLEPKELMDNSTDILVCDGYAGNMVLKSYEGAIKSFVSLIKKEVTKGFIRKLGALILKQAFRDAKEVLDHRNVGGALIMGLESIVVKAHGSSDKKAWIGALNQVKMGLENNVIEKMKVALK